MVRSHDELCRLTAPVKTQPQLDLLLGDQPFLETRQTDTLRDTIAAIQACGGHVMSAACTRGCAFLWEIEVWWPGRAAQQAFDAGPQNQPLTR